MFITSGIPAFAFGPNESRSIDNFFIEAQLLKGDGSGYGLDKTASRLEGIVILIRLMGKDAEAQSMAGQPCQFTDAPDWAKGYVNFAYAENISRGVSETKFGVNDRMTADQYNTLMLRVMGYDDSKGDFEWDDAVDKATDLSILSKDMARTYSKAGYAYTKGDLMETSFCYLEANYKDQDQTLIASLIADKVISDELAEKYGLGVEKWDSFTSSLSSDEYYSLNLGDDVMTISGRSEGDDKEWLLAEIADKATGKEKAAKPDNRDQNGKYDFQITLSNLAKGEYYVNLYGNDEKYNTYHGIINSEIVLKVTATDAYFVPSPVYAENLRIFNGNQVETEDKTVSLATRADKQALEQIRALSDEITKDCGSDYEKVRAIHDWVADYLYYDEDFTAGKYNMTDLTSKSVLENRYAVCSGYSILTQDLLTAAGIPCKLVLGYGLGESDEENWSQLDLSDLEVNHAWNEAYVDGRWIILDTTWDGNNTYKNGTFTRGEGVSQSYFDCSVQYFSYTHKEME